MSSIVTPINQEYILSNRPLSTELTDETVSNIWTLRNCDYPVIKQSNEFIAETLYISVDPYLSSGLKNSALGGNPSPLGSIQISGIVSKVIDSQNTNYPIGTIINARAGWRRYNLFTGSESRIRIVDTPNNSNSIYKQLNLPYSAAIGILGMTAQTAYYGILDVAGIKSTDVLIISGAAGAVGSIAGQIAKKICKAKKVIGIVGGAAKCKYIVDECGFDAAIDYKEYNTKPKMIARLKELANEPITAYFDNTGGFITDSVFDIIAPHSQITICGQISSYQLNPDSSNIFPKYLAATIYRGLTIKGCVVGDYIHRNSSEFDINMPEWIKSGLIKFNETIIEGFDQLPKAYQMLFTGGNIGKVVVKV